MEEFKTWFEETTGLDYDNHTREEYNKWYHNEVSKTAQENSYMAEILKSAEEIIEEKNYSLLIRMLQNYDEMVKERIEHTEDMKEYPYWCYGFNSSHQVEIQ